MKRIILAIAGFGILAGCTPDEEKVQRVVEKALAECKEAEGDFAEIKVVGGTDPVLKDTCDKPIEGVTLKDEFHASAKVGPYDYLVGVDNETGVWVLTQADWEAIDEARRHLAGDDPPKDARERAEKALAKAQEEMPDSAYIRRTRFGNLLAMRVGERGKSEDPASLGTAAQAVLDDSVAWALANNRPDLAAELRIMVVEYYKVYASKLEMAFENVGSGDEHLQALINQAVKDGNKEDEANYRKTLAENLAGRDAEIAKMNLLITTSKKNACDTLQKLDPAGLEGDLRERVVGLKDGTDCSPGAMQPAAKEGDEAPE